MLGGERVASRSLGFGCGGRRVQRALAIDLLGTEVVPGLATLEATGLDQLGAPGRARIHARLVFLAAGLLARSRGNVECQNGGDRRRHECHRFHRRKPRSCPLKRRITSWMATYGARAAIASAIGANG